MPKTKVYIGRLPRELQQADLEDEFKKYGKFVRVDLRSGYGFIDFEDSKDAEEAIDEMDGKSIQGSKIVVEWAGENKKKDRNSRGDRDGNSKQEVCFNCGKKGHWANECKESSWKDRCYRCGGSGHVKKDCTRSRSVSRSRSKSPRRRRGGRSGSRSRSPRNDRSRRRDRNYRNRSRSGSRSSTPPRRDRNRDRNSNKRKSRDSRSRSKSKSASRNRSSGSKD